MSYVAINTSTTGLGDDARVIELSVVSPGGDAWTTRVRPPEGTVMDARATAQHGITLADLEDAPTFADVVDNLVERTRGKKAYFWDSNGLHRRALQTEFDDAGGSIPWDPIDLEALAVERGVVKPSGKGRLSLDGAARALDLDPQLDDTAESRAGQILAVLTEMKVEEDVDASAGDVDPTLESQAKPSGAGATAVKRPSTRAANPPAPKKHARRSTGTADSPRERDLVWKYAAEWQVLMGVWGEDRRTAHEADRRSRGMDPNPVRVKSR